MRYFEFRSTFRTIYFNNCGVTSSIHVFISLSLVMVQDVQVKWPPLRTTVSVGLVLHTAPTLEVIIVLPNYKILHAIIHVIFSENSQE